MKCDAIRRVMGMDRWSWGLAAFAGVMAAAYVWAARETKRSEETSVYTSIAIPKRKEEEGGTLARWEWCQSVKPATAWKVYAFQAAHIVPGTPEPVLVCEWR